MSVKFGLLAWLVLGALSAAQVAAQDQDKPPAANSGKKARKAPGPSGKPKGKKEQHSGSASDPKARAEAGRPETAAPSPGASRPAASSSAAASRPQKLQPSAAISAIDDEDVHKEGGTEIKTVEFGGLDIEGQLKTPQMLYFLNRLRAEFDRPRLPHRSFIPELSRSTKEKDF